MLKITIGLDLYLPWGGAVDTWDIIQENNAEDEFENMMAECYPEGIDHTKLNDVLWFDSDWVLGSLGLKEETEEE